MSNDMSIEDIMRMTWHLTIETCQDWRVSRRDVEVVDVEAGDGEAGAADGADEGDDGRGAAVGVAQVIYVTSYQMWPVTRCDQLPDVTVTKSDQ